MTTTAWGTPVLNSRSYVPTRSGIVTERGWYPDSDSCIIEYRIMIHTGQERHEVKMCLSRADIDCHYDPTYTVNNTKQQAWAALRHYMIEKALI